MSVRTAKSGKSAADQKPVRGAAGGLLFLKSTSTKKHRATRKKNRVKRPSWEHAARGARFK